MFGYMVRPRRVHGPVRGASARRSFKPAAGSCRRSVRTTVPVTTYLGGADVRHTGDSLSRRYSELVASFAPTPDTLSWWRVICVSPVFLNECL